MKKFFFVSSFCLNCFLAFSQNIITDTVYFSFTCDSIIPANYHVSSIEDKRNVNPKLVSYSQVKKYVLIPVDQELCINKPLAESIQSCFPISNKPLDTFCLSIDYFIIERMNGRLFNPYILKADINILRFENGDSLPGGTLIYNYKFQPQSNKKDKTFIYNTMLSKWDTQLKLDMLELTNHFNSDSKAPSSWIEQPFSRSHFLNASVGGVVGIDFWQLEGELYFTRPETETRQVFMANIIRYQKAKDFEVIGFGKKTEHFYKRLNDKSAFDVSTNALLGLVKWKVQEDIKLYQIVQLSLSSNQSICFDKKNQHGWLFKLGLFENFYYTIEMTPKFQVGLYSSFGYKF